MVPALALAAGLTLLSGAPLCAQQSHRAEEAALVRHLDSVVPLYEAAKEQEKREAARAKAHERKMAASTQPKLDTIRVGPLRIVTPSDQAQTAQELFSSVWHGYQPAIHDSPALERTLFTFQWSFRFVPIAIDGPVRRVEARRWDARSHVEGYIRQAIGMALASDLGSTAIGQSWYRAAVRPPPDPAGVYRELATTPSKPNRACLDGDAHACAEALGLGVSPDSWKGWFTPDEERDIALRRFYYFGDRHMIALQDACRNGKQRACAEIVSTFYTRFTRATAQGTLDPDARQSLVWFALERGGAGAWARLLAHPDATPEQALANVSGLNVDRLCGAWRRWVLRQRPDVSAGLGGGMVMAGFWILLFAGLAARSTRWRLG